MGNIKVMTEGTATDITAFRAFVDRWQEHVRLAPGAIALESYFDPGTGAALWLETWADEAAFLNHVTSMSESGLLQELMQVYEMQRALLLTPTDDHQVQQVMQQLGAMTLERVAAVGANC